MVHQFRLKRGWDTNSGPRTLSQMKKERVRDAIECCTCKKWRCIFAAAKPSELQMQQLSKITDTLQYSCGAPLIADDHPLIHIFFIRQDISSANPVEKLYYSCHKFDDVCCWCWALEPTKL